MTLRTHILQKLARGQKPTENESVAEIRGGDVTVGQRKALEKERRRACRDADIVGGRHGVYRRAAVERRVAPEIAESGDAPRLDIRSALRVDFIPDIENGIGPKTVLIEFKVQDTEVPPFILTTISQS